MLYVIDKETMPYPAPSSTYTTQRVNSAGFCLDYGIHFIFLTYTNQAELASTLPVVKGGAFSQVSPDISHSLQLQ